MSARRALRVGLAGATGALGSEVLAVLDARRFPAREIVPLASLQSAGETVEFQGEIYDVRAEPEALRGAELLFLCSPPAASLELVRHALRLEVPCIDLSGALSAHAEVPLLVADLGAPAEEVRKPVIACPSGPALTWALVLAPIARAAGLRRVVGTALESVAGGGRLGIESLSSETIAIFNQQELPEPRVFERPVAFDCLPAVGEVGEDGSTDHEAALARDLRRLLSATLQVAVTALRIPTFAGDGAALALETERPLSPVEARALFAKAPGVELWDLDAQGPTTRATAGRDSVLVGRLRGDSSVPNGLLLWVVGDALRLAAANAVKLAEARLVS